MSRLAAALDRCAVVLIDEILGRLREQSQGYVDENTRRARLPQSFEETWRELAGMLEPLVARLQGALPHIHPNQRHVGFENVLRTSFDATGPHNEMYVCDSWAAMASFGIKHTFVSGVCVEVSNDGELVVTGSHFVDLGVYDQSPEWRTGTERAPIDTVAATAAGRNHRARQVAAARLTVEVGGTHESPRNLDSQACAQLSEQPCALTLTESHALESVLSSLAE